MFIYFINMRMQNHSSVWTLEVNLSISFANSLPYPVCKSPIGNVSISSKILVFITSPSGHRS